MNDIPRKLIVPKNVTDALRTVKYPGSDEDVVSMDMVQEIRIAGQRVNFSLVFQKSDDPNIESLVLECEKAIKTFVGEQVEIEDNIAVKYIHNMERPVLPGVKNIVAVASGKGGVGKSTVAVNLAVALAKSGARVGLIDADIFGPSIPKMFGSEDSRPAGVKIDGRDMIVPLEKYGVKFLSIGFFVDSDSAVIWRGPMASNALKQLIMDANWGELDYMLIDLPPGTSDIHLTLVQTLPVTGAVIVTTPQDVALADVVRGASMFRSKSIDVPVLGLVENMAWFTPAELPDNKYYIFGKDGGKMLAEKLGLKLLGQIPIVQSIREGGDQGVPIAANADSVNGMAFADVAKSVMHQVHLRNIERAPTKKVKITRK
ncbi:MRP family ATP-binding protein [Mariniphaga sediminis]|uniref:Iron-sulfur cluster carrier protein n=1 Tax=Mariniphaga sediminis TaxID=1628158 RepID=A0A399CXT9_9BACT|nr:Mrp/NBP35 family ATP-binding protein [Mariniphaga sediminis]RIH64026.1 MRP family ATP-binding protein [Mariniphaga sediminis]